MAGFQFWQKWLFVVGLIVTAFGAFMAFLNSTAAFDLLNVHYNLVFWGSKSVSGGTKAFQQWIYGAWGGTVVGWGILVAFMAHYPFKAREKWAWTALFTAMLVWFVVDTGISLYFRVYVNAILNAVLFMAIMLPLVFTRRYFVGK